MKKVIIALLVIASLFAFVSCKDEVTYDNWAKMPFLDTSEGEGEIFDIAYKAFWAPSTSFICTSFETMLSFTSTQNDIDGTLIAKSSGENTVYEFNGTISDTPVKGFKFMYDGNSNFLSADGKELPAEKSTWAILIHNSLGCCEAKVAEITEVYETDSEIPVGESTISAIKVSVSGTGYNEKLGEIPSALERVTGLNFFATDYTFEITYDNKTLKATLSTMISEPSSLMTVTIGKKTYLFRESN